MLEASVEIRLLDLDSEVGELAKEFLKGTYYGKKNLSIHYKCEEEFGDVLFSLICIANSTGVDIESAFASVLVKYRDRFNAKGDISSGK